MKTVNTFKAFIWFMFLAEFLSITGRQDGYGGRIRQPAQQRPRVRGNSRPVGQYGVQGQQAQPAGGGGGFGDLLEGIELNLLDAKLIGLGFVREDLVRQLCAKGNPSSHQRRGSEGPI
eukprot:TRINITY_DN29025_c1_g1_i1.p1 TRINITY_DN29025_c1_g1~~TRINITY_DN29025_c1_g1_i1.p1  ORF type:complete len:118 (-),score=24.07 TRINITY_DN29025_c1_g1_i1:21-374(-)